MTIAAHMTPSSDKSLINSGHLAYQSYGLLRRLRVQDTELSKESVSTWILMVCNCGALVQTILRT